MRGVLIALLAALLGAALVAGWAARPGALPARTIHLLETGVPAPSVANAGIRVDLYLPAHEPGTPLPPLLVYATGGLWSMPDVNYQLAASLGDAMQRQGVAVAALRFALVEGYVLRNCAEDVARIVARLAEQADEHGYDGTRIVLGGYGPGALLMSQLALDGDALERAGIDASRLAGVVSLRGIFDLSPEVLAGHPQQLFYEWAVAEEPSARSAFSPIAKVRADAPPFLVLNGGEDLTGYALRAHSFARALERAGAAHVQSYLVPERDGESLLNLSGEGNPVALLVAEFARGDPIPEPIEGPWAVKQIWSREPPLSSEPFWADPSRVQSYPVDDRFRWMLGRIFEKQMHELKPWPGDRYHALDLLDYLVSRPALEVGQGDHLIVTNIRGERIFLTREDLEQHRPRLVVGLDDERNLYRLFASYRMSRLYSWVPEASLAPKMIRPVGAFLHFPDGAPERLWSGGFTAFGLTPQSFRWQGQDPLAPVRELPPDLLGVLTGPSGCLHCHALRSAGARSHHLTAEHAVPHGAYALALEEYPPEVLNAFLFDQSRVSEMFGVNALHVEEAQARALYALVHDEREKRLWLPFLGPLPEFN